MNNPKFKLSFDGVDLERNFENFRPEFDIFKKILPEHFKVTIVNNNIFLEILEKTNEKLPFLYIQEVERELDRYFLLTEVIVNAEQISGRMEKYSCLTVSAYLRVPDNVRKQEWDDTATLVFKLWRMAYEYRNEYKIRILVLYQIIELLEYKIPQYSNHEHHPSIFSECKILRHLVAHSGKVTGEVKKYLTYLQANAIITDADFEKITNQKRAGFVYDQLVDSLILKRIEPIIDSVKELVLKLVTKHYTEDIQKKAIEP